MAVLSRTFPSFPEAEHGEEEIADEKLRRPSITSQIDPAEFLVQPRRTLHDWAIVQRVSREPIQDVPPNALANLDASVGLPIQQEWTWQVGDACRTIGGYPAPAAPRWFAR
jgi:hypothetical protein